ncbi:MAG: hypothetical protein IPP32_12685 [Bacteroidetes bacterium]|nr:hypothetical protein [Bacteroidota bacterium]
MVSNEIGTAEFPYTEQDPYFENDYAQAWTLTKIKLPSGGSINVDYESDDYAYVQNKRAMEMFKVVNLGFISSATFSSAGLDAFIPSTALKAVDLSGNNDETIAIIKLKNAITSGAKNEIFKHDYLAGINHFYFRFLAAMRPGKYEYVSGYVPVGNIHWKNCVVSSNGEYACIAFNNVAFGDGNGVDISPMTKAAIQFGRLNMSRDVWGDDLTGAGESFGSDLLKAIIGSSIVKNIIQSAQGPNRALYQNNHVGEKAIMNYSFLRLNNPDKKKLGGGARVKQIKMCDEWNGMTNNLEKEFYYGQEYSYLSSDGITSSGVASYEPLIGGDENPWKIPVFFEDKHLLAPDDTQYMEEPFGESFFPSPSIGYSRVTVRNLSNTNVNAHATGITVNEFYTSKDFPTIVDRTDLSATRDKSSPASIKSLLRINVKDYLTASQGYVIELNDMNGKPKSISVYPENKDVAISTIRYNYKCTPYNDAFRLDNSATVIYPDGTIKDDATVGLCFDMVSDMRESKTSTISSSINTNIDGFLVSVLPIPFPMIIPSRTKQYTQFRSAVVTKVIQRFGLLQQTISTDLGAKSISTNLAYDSETGEVIATEIQNNFSDSEYSLTFPAHWYYDGMGPASKNINYVATNLTFTNGEAITNNASQYFCEGDELNINSHKVWVSKVTPNSITCIEHDGSRISGGPYNAKIIRSGRRNQLSAPMASITSFSDPLKSLRASSNDYEDVLQATAVEYTNKARTFCELFTINGNDRNISYSTNPFIQGTRGLWKVKKNFLHLTNRSQTDVENNTNIRKDGVFTSFTPYYRLFGGKWDKNSANWTYTSEVTEFSPYGAELENKDALGNYKSATYGYNNSLPTAVASNSKFADIGVDNFEDHNYSDGIGEHFQFRQWPQNTTNVTAHSGSFSRKIEAGGSLALVRGIADCPEFTSCSLKSFLSYSPEAHLYEILAMGDAPYTFEYSVIMGNPLIDLIGAETLSIDLNGSSNVLVKVTITDFYGCKKVEWIDNRD